MEITELGALLRKYGIDANPLSLALSRGDERIYQLMAPPHDAFTYWQMLHDLVPVTGHWPVLGWDRRWLDDVPEYRARLVAGSTAGILAESERVDLARWRQAQIDEFLSLFREDAATNELDEPTDYFEDVEGEWPEDTAPYTEFSTAQPKESREPISPIPVALIPTPHSWQVPAYLRLDAGDATPAVHTAMARSWQERYGAEIVGMLPDLMEMQVAQPPITREEALALAREQYIYCNDVVIQGTQTIQALAAGLLDGTAWFFWWD
jgi:uncharacterized protein DUF4253